MRSRPPCYIRHDGRSTGTYPNSGSGCLWVVAILFALMIIGLVFH